MPDSLGPPRSFAARSSSSPTSFPAARPQPGNILGTSIVGIAEWFIKKFGQVAAHAAVARLGPGARKWVSPHAPALGLLGAKRYPYPFVGELLRTMAAVVHVNEDAMLVDMANAGVDMTLSTVARVVLRYATSPKALAARGQELWNVFHDCGRITISNMTDHEYIVELSDWPNHDVTVCKLAMEARRRVIEKTGVKVEVRREKCQAWGHDVCTARVRWAP